MIVRAYDGLWNVEKRLYKVEDWEVPGSPLYSQIGFFFVGLVFIICMLGILGLNGQRFCLVKYGAFPVAFSMFMTKVRFDGKRPDRFLKSVCRYFLSDHVLCRYEAIKKPGKYVYEGTVVRVIGMQENGGQKRRVKWGMKFR